jgi:hypothetical protein
VWRHHRTVGRGEHEAGLTQSTILQRLRTSEAAKRKSLALPRTLFRIAGSGSAPELARGRRPIEKERAFLRIFSTIIGSRARELRTLRTQVRLSRFPSMLQLGTTAPRRTGGINISETLFQGLDEQSKGQQQGCRKNLRPIAYRFRSTTATLFTPLQAR